MEKYEYEDGTLPLHVAHHLRQIAEEKALKLLEEEEREEDYPLPEFV